MTATELELAGAATRDLDTASGNPWHDANTGKFADAPPGMKVLRGAELLKSMPGSSKKLIEDQRKGIRADALVVDDFGDNGARVIFFKGSKITNQFFVPTNEIGTAAKQAEPEKKSVLAHEHPDGDYAGLTDLAPYIRETMPADLRDRYDRFRNAVAVARSMLNANPDDEQNKLRAERGTEVLAQLTREQENIHALMQKDWSSIEDVRAEVGDVHARNQAVGDGVTELADQVNESLMRGDNDATERATRGFKSLVTRLLAQSRFGNIFSGELEILADEGAVMGMATSDGDVKFNLRTVRGFFESPLYAKDGSIPAWHFGALNVPQHEAEHLSISEEANKSLLVSIVTEERLAKFSSMNMEEGFVELLSRHKTFAALKAKGIAVEGDPLTPGSQAAQSLSYPEQYEWAHKAMSLLRDGLRDKFGMSNNEATEAALHVIKRAQYTAGTLDDRARILHVEAARLGKSSAMQAHVDKLPGGGPAINYRQDSFVRKSVAHGEWIDMAGMHGQSGAREFSLGERDAMHVWADPHYQENWLPHLTKPENDALISYMHNSDIVNDHLRGKETDTMIGAPSIEQWVTKMDSALEHARLHEDVTVYRGIVDDGMTSDPEAYVGDMIRDKGFTSTTLDPAIAESFAGYGEGATILKIDLPKGSRAGYIDALDVKGDFQERELLLARGSALQITAFDGEDYMGRPIFRARLMQQLSPVGELSSYLDALKQVDTKASMAGGEFPAKFSQKWLDNNVMELTTQEFKQLTDRLYDKGWTDGEISKRVLPKRLEALKTKLEKIGHGEFEIVKKSSLEEGDKIKLANGESGTFAYHVGYDNIFKYFDEDGAPRWSEVYDTHVVQQLKPGYQAEVSTPPDEPADTPSMPGVKVGDVLPVKQIGPGYTFQQGEKHYKVLSVDGNGGGVLQAVGIDGTVYPKEIPYTSGSIIGNVTGKIVKVPSVTESVVTPEAATAPITTIPVPEDGVVVENWDLGNDLTFHSNADGTTGAKWYTDKSGNRWIVKQDSADRMASEALANAIYRELGAPVAGLVRTNISGKDVIAMREIKGSTLATLSTDSVGFKAAQTAARKHFMADALVANWDVAGTGYDNMLVGPDALYRVDAGGVFEYRAQGGTKEFGPHPGEIESLLDPHKNPYSAKLFDGITQEELADQAHDIAALLTDEKIDKLVWSAGFDDVNMEESVRVNLKARRDVMKKLADASQNKVGDKMPAAEFPGGEKFIETTASLVNVGDEVWYNGKMYEVDAASSYDDPDIVISDPYFGGDYEVLPPSTKLHMEKKGFWDNVVLLPAEPAELAGDTPVGTLKVGDTFWTKSGEYLSVEKIWPTQIEATDIHAEQSYIKLDVGVTPDIVGGQQVETPKTVAMQRPLPVTHIEVGKSYMFQDIPDGAVVSLPGLPSSKYTVKTDPTGTKHLHATNVHGLVSDHGSNYEKTAGLIVQLLPDQPVDIMVGDKVTIDLVPVGAILKWPSGAMGKKKADNGGTSTFSITQPSGFVSPDMELDNKNSLPAEVIELPSSPVPQVPQGMSTVQMKLGSMALGLVFKDATGGFWYKSGLGEVTNVTTGAKKPFSSEGYVQVLPGHMFAGPGTLKYGEWVKHADGEYQIMAEATLGYNAIDANGDMVAIPKGSVVISISGPGAIAPENELANMSGVKVPDSYSLGLKTLQPGDQYTYDGNDYEVTEAFDGSHTSVKELWGPGTELKLKNSQKVDVVTGPSFDKAHAETVKQQEAVNTKELSFVKIGSIVKHFGKEYEVTGIDGHGTVKMKSVDDDHETSAHHTATVVVKKEGDGKLAADALPVNYPLPPKVIKSWYETHIPMMTPKQFQNFKNVLKYNKGWTSSELASKIQPHWDKMHAPAGSPAAKAQAAAGVKHGIVHDHGAQSFTSAEAGAQWAKSKLGGLKNRILAATNEHMWNNVRNALHGYFNGTFGTINSNLRKSDFGIPMPGSDAAKIKEAFKHANGVDVDTILVRNTNWPVDINKGEALIGQYIRDKGFMSSTYYAPGTWSNGHRAKILVPAGTKVIYANDSSMSPHPGEKEVLIDSNAIMEIVSIDQVPGGYGGKTKPMLVLRLVGYATDQHVKVEKDKSLSTKEAGKVTVGTKTGELYGSEDA